jgi:hypothetical protein
VPFKKESQWGGSSTVAGIEILVILNVESLGYFSIQERIRFPILTIIPYNKIILAVINFR